MPSANSLLAFTTSHLGSTDDYGDEGYLSVGASQSNQMEEPPSRRGSTSMQQVRRMFGTATISSKLITARASLPRFRASLPSLPTMPKLSRGRPASRSMDEPVPSSDRKSTISSRFDQLLAMKTRLRRHSKTKNPAKLPSPEYHADNQSERVAVDDDFDATLSATLTWIEAMDQDDSLCAYALEDLTGSEASRYSSSSSNGNNQEEMATSRYT